MGPWLSLVLGLPSAAKALPAHGQRSWELKGREEPQHCPHHTQGWHRFGPRVLVWGVQVGYGEIHFTYRAPGCASAYAGGAAHLGPCMQSVQAVVSCVPLCSGACP